MVALVWAFFLWAESPLVATAWKDGDGVHSVWLCVGMAAVPNKAAAAVKDSIRLGSDVVMAVLV